MGRNRPRTSGQVIEFTRYLHFPGCEECIARPCMDLRFGRVYTGKLQLVAARTVPREGCPLVCTDRFEIAVLLRDLPLQQLIHHAETAFDELGPGDQMRLRMDSFCQDYRDRSGRIRFIETLIDEGLVCVVRIPEGYQYDARMLHWFGSTRRVSAESFA